MASVVARQIDAFGEAVTAAPGASAISFWDVQDLVMAAPALVELFEGMLRARAARSWPTAEEREQFSALAEKLLLAMSNVRGQARLLADRGTQEIRGIAEFDDALVGLRAILARLMETSQNGPSVPNRTLADFVRASDSHPPKQSWFAEDLDGLRGPDAK